MSTELRKNIARRKRIDVVFALVGAFLIVGSLGVLGVLIGQLVADGSGKLTSTSLLKQDGSAPSRRDVVGRIERGEGGAWLLSAEQVPLNTKNVETDLAPFDGKRVILSGSAPEEDEAMEVDGVKPVPAAGEEVRLGRRDMVGTLNRDANEKDPALAWSFTPDKLKLQSDGMSFDFAAQEKKPVALAGKRTPDGVMTVGAMEPLIEKSFFGSMPSRKADRAGIQSAWVGSLLVMLVTISTALPLGVAAGVYLEEYAKKNWMTALIEINIANLAGVPSIIWGLMALGLFVYGLGVSIPIPQSAPGPVLWVLNSFDDDGNGRIEPAIGRNVLSAGLTLGLLVLPIVIIATREAIRAVPGGIRDASIALGATKWETVRHHVLPYSLGGILTGTIVSMSRAIGETAPLITIGALTYVAFLPDAPVQADFPFVNFRWLDSPFTVLPIQMFNWISRPDRAFHNNAAAAGVVLIAMTLSLNAVAIYLRYRLRRSIKW